MSRLAAIITCALLCHDARGEPNELRIAAGPLFGTEFSAERQDGLGLALMIDYGLTDLLAISAGAGYARHFLGGGTGYDFAQAGIGLLANLDVLVVVPYLALRVGWLFQRLEGSPATSGLGLAVAVGADYLWTESFTAGLFAEYHGMLTDFSRFPSYLSVGLRLGYRRLD